MESFKATGVTALPEETKVVVLDRRE